MDELAECTKCRFRVSSFAEICPHCGQKREIDPHALQKRVAAIGATGVALAVLFPFSVTLGMVGVVFKTGEFIRNKSFHGKHKSLGSLDFFPYDLDGGKEGHVAITSESFVFFKVTMIGTKIVADVPRSSISKAYIDQENCKNMKFVGEVVPLKIVTSANVKFDTIFYLGACAMDRANYALLKILTYSTALRGAVEA